MEKMLLTIKEVCELIGLGRSTVYAILGKPDGIPIVRINSAVRVPTAALRDWVEAQQTTGNSPKINQANT